MFDKDKSKYLHIPLNMFIRMKKGDEFFAEMLNSVFPFIADSSSYIDPDDKKWKIKTKYYTFEMDKCYIKRMKHRISHCYKIEILDKENNVISSEYCVGRKAEAENQANKTMLLLFEANNEINHKTEVMENNSVIQEDNKDE